MQVRKMVAVLNSMVLGELEPEEVKSALEGTQRLAVAPAPGENLILWDVSYKGIDFRVEESCVAGAKEFLEEAKIGAIIEIECVSLPYRPVSSFMFRGGQGHSNCFHQYFATCLLNQLVGNVEAVGGTVGWPARGLGYPETEYP